MLSELMTLFLAIIKVTLHRLRGLSWSSHLAFSVAFLVPDGTEAFALGLYRAVAKP